MAKRASTRRAKESGVGAATDTDIAESDHERRGDAIELLTDVATEVCDSCCAADGTTFSASTHPAASERISNTR